MNQNIEKFATELSKLIGQPIGLDHIHTSDKGRYFYIQAPKRMSPMLLHHYRGPYFVDLHPEDYEDLISGRVDAHEYIQSANWQVGYYWGGGSMLSGGYYQPMDLIQQKDEIRRYLKILSCRGAYISSGYMPTEEVCAKCNVDNCPFSKYKEGDWSKELQEHDPRVDLFYALRERFKQENPGYTLRGFLCGKIPEGEIWLSPNARFKEEDPISFTVYAANELIQALLMHETAPEDWAEYSKSFTFKVEKSEHQMVEATPRALKNAYEECTYLHPEKPVEEKVVEVVKVQQPLLTRIKDRLFKR